MTRLLVVADIVVAIGWAIASVTAMTWATLVNLPDYLHSNYGFPLTFAIHTLDTIAGPVDKWRVDIGALSFDLAFWFLGMVLILGAAAHFLHRNSKGENRASIV